LWTVLPRARYTLAPWPAPAGEAWSVVVEEPGRGPVVLRGLLRRAPESRAVVVLLHGLGGNADSPYVRSSTAALTAEGVATLRLNLRGADPEGSDFYHAGLTADLAAAVASPELAAYERVYVLGFSLGGHLALRYAAERPDPRLRAVAAVSAPLELQPAQRAIDRFAAWPYRAYVLGRLKRTYAEIARRGSVPTPPERVARVRTLRDFDRLTVVPRFGFTSPEDYYARASAGPLLPGLTVPARLVASPGDPMVPSDAIAGAAARAPGLQVSWVAEGGHVGFPGDLDLGEPGGRGLERQLTSWLLGR
jgi:predicted alpha/beta-fold hydrolase